LKPIFQIVIATLLAPIVAAAIGGSVFIFYGILDARAGQKFEEIRWEESEASVNSFMGEPDKVLRCGDNLWWGDNGHYLGRNDGSCVTEVRYEYFLSTWAVGYSAEGRVVSKYHYFSE